MIVENTISPESHERRVSARPRPRGRPAGAALASAVVATSIACVTLYCIVDLLVRGTENMQTRDTQWLAVALSVLILIRLLWVVCKPDFDFCHASFYLFTLVWMGLAPLAQLALLQMPIKVPLNIDLYVTSLVLTALGILAYELGYGYKPRRRRTRRSEPSTGGWRMDERRLLWLTAIGLLAVAALAMRIGGLPILFSSRSIFSTAVFGNGGSKASGAAINAVLLVVPFACSLGWVTLWRAGRLTHPLSHMTLVAALVANAVVNNPLGQSRFWVATVYLSLLGAYFTPRWPQFPRIAAAISLVFLIVVFPFSDVFRHSGGDKKLRINDPVSQLATKGDFDAFVQLSSSVRYTQRNGFQLGQQAAGAVGFFVPRTYWPQKAEDTGMVLGKEARLGNVNLSAPLWAEGYIDFGYAGAPAYLFALGVLGRRLARLSRPEQLGPGFACFLGVYQFVLLRGSLLQAMGITMVSAVCLRIYLVRDHQSTS